MLAQLFRTLHRSMFDYALDRRGDVGSWVREESMRTLTLLVQAVSCICQTQDQWVGATYE